MSDLARVIHLIATDPDFRAALVDDPEAALIQSGLKVSPHELAALSSATHLLARPAHDLLDQLLRSTDGPEQMWQFRARSEGYASPETR